MTRFWEQKANFSFLFSTDQAVPTWWSTLPIYAPVLVGWAAGPKFRPDLNMGDASSVIGGDAAGAPSH